jgi:hypothetical protein
MRMNPKISQMWRTLRRFLRVWLEFELLSKSAQELVKNKHIDAQARISPLEHYLFRLFRLPCGGWPTEAKMASRAVVLLYGNHNGEGVLKQARARAWIGGYRWE